MDLNSPLAVLVPPLLPSRGCMLSCCVLCYIILRIHLLHLFSLNTYKVTALSFQTSFSPQTSGTENEFEVLLLFFFFSSGGFGEFNQLRNVFCHYLVLPFWLCWLSAQYGFQGDKNMLESQLLEQIKIGQGLGRKRISTVRVCLRIIF